MFTSGFNSRLNIDNMTLYNGHFKDGTIGYGYSDYPKVGRINMSNSVVDHIYSENGAIIKDCSHDIYGKITFDNVTFKNVVAKKYGGIMYSMNPFSNYIFSFNNCTFENIEAELGK